MSGTAPGGLTTEVREGRTARRNTAGQAAALQSRRSGTPTGREVVPRRTVRRGDGGIPAPPIEVGRMIANAEAEAVLHLVPNLDEEALGDMSLEELMGDEGVP